MRLYGAGGLSWMQSTSPLVQLNEERARAHADAAAVPVGVVMLKLGPFLDVFLFPPPPPPPYPPELRDPSQPRIASRFPRGLDEPSYAASEIGLNLGADIRQRSLRPAPRDFPRRQFAPTVS